MVVLAFCNHKGGTGKTTSVIQIAGALGLSGYRTLAIDLDPQCFLSEMLGVEAHSEEESALALFQHDNSLQTVQPARLPTFDLLPSTAQFTYRMRKLNSPLDVLWMREALAASTGMYDVVILDTAAAFSVYSVNAMVAADYIIIPAVPEYQGYLGAAQTYGSAQMVRRRLNPSLKDVYLLLAQVDGRKKEHREYRRKLRTQYEDHVLQQVIRTSAVLSKRHEDGTTVFEHAPGSRGMRDYANLADELIRRMGLVREETSPDVSAHTTPSL